MPIGVCHPFFINSYYFRRVMKWKWCGKIRSSSWRLQSSMEVRYYDQEFGPIKFTSRRKYGVPRKAYIDSKRFMEIQKEATKLLKVTIIVPYRLMSGPIIEEIDDN